MKSASLASLRALNVDLLCIESTEVARAALVAAGLIENDELVGISGFLALLRGKTAVAKENAPF